jgi:hypothetical protein
LYERKELRAAVRALPMHHRATYRQLSIALVILKSKTLFKVLQNEGIVYCHILCMKPCLTNENKLACYHHALDEVFTGQGLIVKRSGFSHEGKGRLQFYGTES